MGNRFIKAVEALAVVLLITVACLAFMPWQIGDVVEPLEETNRCMILRYDHEYSTAYPSGEALELLVTTLADAKGHFDRNRSQLVYWGEEPLYRIYFWTSEGRIPDVWLCGTAFFYEGSQYVLNDDDAAAINEVLASCFEDMQ